METATLKNGSTEAMSLVAVTTLSLEDLLTEDPITFYELVQKCKDANHTIFSPVQAAKLEKLGFFKENNIHDSIKNIVLSSVEGDGLDMKLISPIAS